MEAWRVVYAVEAGRVSFGCGGQALEAWCASFLAVEASFYCCGGIVEVFLLWRPGTLCFVEALLFAWVEARRIFCRGGLWRPGAFLALEAFLQWRSGPFAFLSWKSALI